MPVSSHLYAYMHMCMCRHRYRFRIHAYKSCIQICLDIYACIFVRGCTSMRTNLMNFPALSCAYVRLGDQVDKGCTGKYSVGCQLRAARHRGRPRSMGSYCTCTEWRHSIAPFGGRIVAGREGTSSTIVAWSKERRRREKRAG